MRSTPIGEFGQMHQLVVNRRIKYAYGAFEFKASSISSAYAYSRSAEPTASRDKAADKFVSSAINLFDLLERHRKSLQYESWYQKVWRSKNRYVSASDL